MLSQTFKELYKKTVASIKPEEACRCGKVPKDHCNAFKDKIWFGCLKKVKEDDVQETP